MGTLETSVESEDDCWRAAVDQQP